MPTAELFERLWKDYEKLNPVVGKIVSLLEAKGEHVVNDHIALRTIEGDAAGLAKLAEPFINIGYKPKDTYEFKQKKLRAQYFSHADQSMPRVFISELILGSFSNWLQDYFKKILISCKDLSGEELLFSFCPWGKVSFHDYEKLLSESEYAAWMAIYGYRANHFTVNFNELKSWQNLGDYNAYLKTNGILLNASGGEIKGSSAVYLEQSSTLASKVPASFIEGDYTIPCCYFEFAKRYKMPNGVLFDGFIADSADKIFESTDTGKSK